MYKVLGVVEDKFLVSEDGGQEEIVSAEELVLGISYGQEFDGCEYGPKGLKVWFEGKEPYDVEVEVWKPVVYRRKSDGSLETTYSYAVSNLGRVKGLERKDNRGRRVAGGLLKSQASGRDKNYRRVSLHISDGCRHFSVHILVGLAYIPNVNNFPVINHKDENPANNSAYNLEWCTVAYNNTYGHRMEHFVASKSLGVRQYSYTGEIIREFDCAADAARLFGCNANIIQGVCRGTTYSSHGFIWRYISDDDLFTLSKEDRVALISKLRRCRARGVRQYTLSGDFIAEYVNVDEASRNIGVRYNGIGECCRGRSKTSFGFVWRYACDDEFADRPENAKAIEEFRKKNGGAINGA